jgi:hypothetical protein
MDCGTFQERLCEAACRAVEFARRFVREELPDGVAFLVYPNQSYDDNPLVGDEAVFPEDSLPDEGCHGPWSVKQAADFLCRGGRVPEWINIAVSGEDGLHTEVSLHCCGRFTARDDLLYHREGGLPPFSVKSPYLPPGWESVEASGRFPLRWQQR